MRLVYGDEPAREYRVAARSGRAHHHHGRLFQDLCHDRLAAGLWRHAGGAGGKGRTFADPQLGCTATFTQIAGVEALTGPQEQVEVVRVEYQRRRDLMVEGLNKIPGVTCRSPQGAFYAFPNIKYFGRSSDDLADFLLNQAGVAVLPGTAFGAFGEGYLRLCYANSYERIQQALDRMADALAQL